MENESNTMHEKLKSYFQGDWSETGLVAYEDGDYVEYENHICNFDPPSELGGGIVESRLTSDELTAMDAYFSDKGRLPVIGVLMSANTAGEYPWSFEGCMAYGGYANHTCHAGDDFFQAKGGRYLIGDDVDWMIHCLVNLLFKDCAADSADETALFGWIYVADLQNGKAYYGSLEGEGTIFPPNYYDDQSERKTVGQVVEEKDEHVTDFPLYRELLASSQGAEFDTEE